MSKQYDVIVIGAGNGGLAAAATCARAGLSTLLLERHNIPGGSASSFVRGRFEFEPSLHELAGVGAPDKSGQIEDMFIRMEGNVDWCQHDSTFRLVIPAKEGDTDTFINENGVEVVVDARMPVGFEPFARKLDELVPGSYESCMEAFRLSDRMFKAFDCMDDLSKLPGSLKDVPNLMRMISHTMKEALDALGMPKKAQDIFNTYWCYLGSPASQLDFLYYLAMLHSYVKNGTGIPKLRSHEMSLGLDDVIRRNGGEIWYNSEVTKVIVKDGKPAGVVINGNKEVTGKYFICNSYPYAVFKDLFDAKDIPEQQLKMLNARKTACSLTTVYLGMNKTKEELGIKDYSVFIAPDSDSDKQYEVAQNFFSGYCIINCLNEIIPDCTPEGTSQLFLTTMTFGDVMKDVKPEDYKKFKTKVARDMIETCEKALNISIMPYIEEIEIALPPTFARYLNTPFGTPYGYMLEKWDSMIPRTVQYLKDQPFDNFFFCGASQERGDGYGCAYYTGEKAGGLVVNAMKKEGK
ncbi:MAG: NAD(P)/FAD-dependent oxidoreductase [Ruminococcaceae bacterium]|nr:NAD(P)/FAD-dependent oxidoreductase [Oscillospiraceae bacterium]